MEFKGQVGQDKWVCDRLGYKIGGYFMDTLLIEKTSFVVD